MAVVQRVRTLRKGRGGAWRAYVTNEVKPRCFPADYEAEDCLFDLELEGFDVTTIRKRTDTRRKAQAKLGIV